MFCHPISCSIITIIFKWVEQTSLLWNVFQLSSIQDMFIENILHNQALTNEEITEYNPAECETLHHFE